MNLAELLNDPNLPALELSGLSEHTAEVMPGYGFLGIAQSFDALEKYCQSAVESGAAALLVDAPHLQAGHFAVPCIQVPGLAGLRGRLAADFYDHPSEKLTCIGVTGTNGKTSVAYHLADLGSRLGLPMGYSGTLGWGCLNQLQDVHMTTANAVALQRQLAEMASGGLQGVALEVSSHALAQNRARDVHFDYAVFTNLTRDHLDYHGSFAAYAAAKSKLFTDWELQAAVINVADPFGQSLVERIQFPVVTYGEGGDWSWQSEPHGIGLQVSWTTPNGVFVAHLESMADYAVANITAAMATLVATGVSTQAVFERVSQLRSVPGRLERVGASPTHPKVVVDYAHTPDALAKVLASLRPFCEGQLMCVVGCGGDRDSGKRPLMGAAAATGADVVWLTSDNPRSEEPAEIIAQMRAGAVGENAGLATKIIDCVDRAAAIRAALTAATPKDVVLIAGKGHENYQEIAGKKYPFDDRLVATQILEELH